MVKERSVLSNLLKYLHHGLFPIGFLLVIFIGCKNPTAITGTLSYDAITTSFGVETTATPISRPTGTVAYSIAPVVGGPMPTGISIDGATGEITVTDQAEVQEITEYIVTAAGRGDYTGTETATVGITITAAQVGNLSYTDIDITFGNVGSATATWSDNPEEPTVSYNIAPVAGGTMPTGINIDETTGVITVSAEAVVQEAINYTVTATPTANYTATTANVGSVRKSVFFPNMIIFHIAPAGH